MLANETYNQIFGTDIGPYGIGSMIYGVGGPVISQLHEASRTLWSIFADVQRGKEINWTKVSSAVHGASELFVPLYHLANRIAGAEAE
jgi:hypothetical protein